MTTLKYRGRVVTAQDILYIRELDRGTSTGEPTAAVGEVVRSLPVEASRRRLA